MSKIFLLLTLTFLNVSFSQDEAKSDFTSVYKYTPLKIKKNGKGCIALKDQNNEVDSRKWECPSFGGYKLINSGSDGRYDLTLVYDGQKIFDQRKPSFSDLPSAVAQWVFHINESKSKLVALIYRLDYDYDYNKSKNILRVIRLDKEKTCLIGEIEQDRGKNQNEEARNLANDMNAPCI
jgi:hypothetical protein